ncbi:ABC transporter ATP-binding protein/permease [Tissierella pigra]|nr:ABC transporter ATP-binding protein [Tissierella pigra]MBU5427478.1 ABC transporter ATP-binding protein/permease [Tissierella pigra]
MENKKFKSMDNLIFVIKHISLWQKSIFISIGLYSILYAVSPFIWVYIPKFLIDELLGGKRPDIIVRILGLGLIIASVIGFLVEYLQGKFRMKMNVIRYNFIHMLSEKSMTMDFLYTEDPDTLNDINIALDTVQNPMSGVGIVILKLFSILGSIIGFFGFVTIIFRLSPVILMILILTVLLSYLIMVKAKQYERSRKDDLYKEKRESIYSSSTLSDFQFGKDIRVYGLKNILFSKKVGSDKRLLEITKEIQNQIFKSSTLDGILFFIRESVIYSYLIYKVIYGNLSISDFVMYSVAMNSFAIWMDTTMKDISIIRIQSLYIGDFREFLNKKEPKKILNPINIPKTEKYKIEFDNISFKYPNSERYIFKDFSLVINPGERLAIVGINGAGKTTLVKLLTGLYSPNAGEIRVNGININKFNKEEYLDLLSVVFQDIKIFPFNIRENISFSNTFDEIKLNESIEQSGLKDKIQSLEKGVETNMLKILDEEGIELSGGENQKLAIARALYKNGKILIMDEPTASLDALAENRLYESFDKLISGKTAIYISHRLSSTRFCDKIAFIENGQLQEYGTHDELMKLDSLYANMFNIQSRYYKEDKAYA